MSSKSVQDLVVASQGPQDDEVDNGVERLAPIPFDENNIKPEDRNWVSDYGDNIIPRGKGFITDFVYHTRGYMIPTLACVWSALYILSTVVKREVWLQWKPRALFANLFMIIVGPAGRVKKTTAITDIGFPILDGFRKYLTDRNLYRMKDINVVMDKMSPEALINSMLPENKEQEDFFFVDNNGEYIVDSKGKAIKYTQTSETAIIVSELSTLLSASQYTVGMANLLLDLYDTKEIFHWVTLGRGKQVLRKLYTTFIAGTTIEGLRNSIPPAAKGDGFLSRTIMVFVPSSKRVYDMPEEAKGSPTYTDMCIRLAWVAEHALGEFKLSDEARAEYAKWYQWHYRNMEDNPELEGAISRRDVILLKTALLIRLSRYEGPEGVIEMQDLMDAIRLIEMTYTNLPFLLGQLNPDDFMANAMRLEVKLRDRPQGMGKWDIGRALKIKTDMLHALLDDFAARKQIYFEYEGKKYYKSVRKYDERVFWIGDGNEGDDHDGTGNPFKDWKGSYLNDAESVRKSQKGRKNSGRKSYGAPAIHGDEPDFDAADYAGSGSKASTISNKKKESTRRIRKVDPKAPKHTAPEKGKRDSANNTSDSESGKVVSVPKKNPRKKDYGNNTSKIK